MYNSTSKQHYNDENNHSFHYTTPNSRIVPASSSPSTSPDYHANWRQPERTSSLQPSQPKLQKQYKEQYYHDRESLIDPARHQGYSDRETLTESAFSIEDYYVHSIPIPIIPGTANDNHMNYYHQKESPHHHHHHQQQDPEIQTVKSQSKYVPIKVQHAYANVPQPSVAVFEHVNNFSLQKKSSNTTMRPNTSTSTIAINSTRLPKPPLTPLVIPPSTMRSSSSPDKVRFVAATCTPTRSSSMQQNSPPMATTLSTPGSSTSANSPLGLSPFYSPCTPSPNTHLPHNTLPSRLGPHSALSLKNNGVKTAAATCSKKLSMQPDNEAERLVHQGIKYHEAGKLDQATDMFKQASALNLPIAMFLYGVSLRHGWGCKRNEHLAFQYLQKAAEHAVEDLTNLTSAVSASASKGELIMAIYELGVSFRHGWGCKKNKEIAVHYFQIAADLNDADAQNDLGHCYYHGHGIKKDLHMAAKYYRKADQQGQGIMGNSWIWKSKYDV